MVDHQLQAIKGFLQSLLSDKRCLSREDNVLYCKKLFIVNSVMNWLLAELRESAVTIDEMKEQLVYINRYLDDEIILYWENGVLMFYEKKGGM